MNIVYRAPCELKPYDKNAKKHDEVQVANVAESIRQYGFVQPIVIDRNNVVVVGHCRLLASKKLKLRSVPCVCVDDLTDEQVKALRIVDNKTNESPWDFDFLAADLPDIDLGEFAFDFNADFSEPPALLEGKEPTADYERKKREFEERMAAGELSDDDEEYQAFLEKFEPKKTTDDCYTPPIVYDAVADYVAEKYGVSKDCFVRPFVPQGDYQAEKYKTTDIVVDNPPFSILAEILHFYNKNGIRYFLFAPHLTLFSSASKESSSLICGASITYENGAVVNTSFVTNLEDCAFRSCPDLFARVKKANDENVKQQRKELPKYSYPLEVVTVSAVAPYSRLGIEFRVERDECEFIRQLDSQKGAGKGLFGSGFLISERKTAEREKAEREKAEREKAEREKAERWTLSERETEIIKKLK